MSLDTYANLKLELAAWTARADLSVTSGGLDTYIDMAESWFNRNLRVQQMVTTNAALTVSAGGAITHPTDWLAWKQIAIMNTPIQVLAPTSESALLLFNNTNATGFPKKYVVRGSSTQVWPAPMDTYTYRGLYFGTIPALSGSNTTNWLLTAYPEAYLFGSLLFGYAYFQADDRVPLWQQGFDKVMGEITSLDNEYGTDIDSPMIRNAI